MTAMTVAALLRDKGRSVITTSATASIAGAIDALARHKIGALVVIDEKDRIAGIMSERDIVRAIAARGADVLNAPISDAMTRAVVTCTESDTVDEVMARMTRGRFRHLPVVEDGNLVGIVSIGDVVKARIEQVEREAEDMRAYIAAV
jgi:CBS domain-containing protein